MKPGQKLRDSQGRQVLLFPLEYLYISQDEYGSYSHAGTLNIDFLGYNASGRLYDCPYYAPCDMVCVYQSTSAAYNIWNSLEKVLLSDARYDYICMMVIHDETLPSLGSTRYQGDLIGHTGTAGETTGDHVHMNIALGHYAGQEQPAGHWQLKNSIHIYNSVHVNNTTILNGLSHTWKSFAGGVTPPLPPLPPGIKKEIYHVWDTGLLMNQRRRRNIL